MSNDLMQKLAISKKIMDRHNGMGRNNSQSIPKENISENINYNLPNEVNIPNIKPNKPISEAAVMNSKLPDEIKKLMIENPIEQPQMSSPILSDEIIQGATRLMGDKKQQVENTTTPQNGDLRQMIRDVVRDTVRDVVREEMREAGLISESTQKTNETLSLRVGKHIFEGKVLKIKKVKQ
jgi:hypothetical protein